MGDAITAVCQLLWRVATHSWGAVLRLSFLLGVLAVAVLLLKSG